MLRWMVYNFLQNNKTAKIHEFDIEECILSDASSLKEYLTEIVLKEREEARTLIIAIAPIVLRINLQVALFDLRVEKNTEILTYEAKDKGNEIYESDSLNLHDEWIHIMLKYGHYDLLYLDKEIKKFPFLLEYDKTPMKLYYNPSLHSSCAFCDKLTSEIDNVFTLACGHMFHNYCLAKHIEENTINKVALTNKEKSNLDPIFCTKCNELIKEPDYDAIFSQEIMSHYRSLAEYREKRESEENETIDIFKGNKSIEKEYPLIEGAICVHCSKGIHENELYMLDVCSHIYHISCLKTCIEIQSEGKIFLTQKEQEIEPILCVACQEIIPEHDIEQVFYGCQAAIKYYKNERDLRNPEKNINKNEDIKEIIRLPKKNIIQENSSDPNDFMIRLNCCEKVESARKIKDLIKIQKIVDLNKKGQVVICKCPFCPKHMNISEIKQIFDEDELYAMLNSICANCFSRIGLKSTPAACGLHLFCEKCTAESECKICKVFIGDSIKTTEKPKKKTEKIKTRSCGKRNSAEKPKNGILCIECKNYYNSIDGILLGCYHFICNLCDKRKIKKQAILCPECYILECRVKFCKCGKNKEIDIFNGFQKISRKNETVIVLCCQKCGCPIEHKEILDEIKESDLIGEIQKQIKKDKNTQYLFNLNNDSN